MHLQFRKGVMISSSYSIFFFCLRNMLNKNKTYNYMAFSRDLLNRLSEGTWNVSFDTT